MIWIFIEGEGDEIKSRLPFKTFSTLKSDTMMKMTSKLGYSLEVFSCEPFDTALFLFDI